MRTLVTGATGFVGARLVRALVGRGERLHVFCHPNHGPGDIVDGRVTIHWGDILDPAAIREAARGCDRVYHLAAYARNWASDPRTFFRSNVQGLENVLNAAADAGARRVVFTSTCLTVGSSNGRPVDESSARRREPYTFYEESKLVAEERAARAAASGLPVVIVNPTRVFGPGPLSESNSVTRMVCSYLNGRWRVLLGDGGALGNYAYVDDVVDGHIRAMEMGRPAERYLLGGENVSLSGFFERLARVAGLRRRRLVPVPAAVAIAVGHLEIGRARWLVGHPAISPEWVRTFLDDWEVSSAKAEGELGYRITPLDEALARTIAWLEATGRTRRGAR